MKHQEIGRSKRGIIAAMFLLFVLSPNAPESEAGLKAGCAKINITPPVGIGMAGYAGRDSGSRGIADELYSKALVLSDGRSTVAILTLDIIGISLEITREVRKIVEEKTGIPAGNILISCTHTHFGPNVFRTRRDSSDTENGEIEKAYGETLIRKIAGAVFVAHAEMKDAKAGAARGQLPEIVFNRRPKQEDGMVKTMYSVPEEVAVTRMVEKTRDGLTRVTFATQIDSPALEFGPIDPEIWALRVEDSNGKSIGAMVNFACHAVSGSTFPDWFYSISADFPGVAQRVVEEAEGGICLYAAGTSGDIVPIQRGKEPRFMMGKAIGGEALRQLQFVKTSGDAEVRALSKAVTFAIRPDRIRDESTLVSEVQAFKIGDIYVLGLPGEVLVEIGLEIKKRAGLKNLLITALSNDAIGYVLHGAGYEEGGYELTACRLAKGSGEIMIEEALKLLKRISE